MLAVVLVVELLKDEVILLLQMFELVLIDVDFGGITPVEHQLPDCCCTKGFTVPDCCDCCDCCG